MHDTRGPHIAGGRTRGDSSADGLTLRPWRVGRSIETTLSHDFWGTLFRSFFFGGTNTDASRAAFVKIVKK